MSLSKSQAPSLRLTNPPAFVEHGGLRFLIMDAPSDNTLPLYMKEFEKYHVTDVVRVCNPTYSKQTLEKDWPFEDGEPPPQSVIDRWLELVRGKFGKDAAKAATNTPTESGPCIATHCVAGLGRAPVLVAIALIEQGMSPLDSVAYVRERRRGAINNKQLKFLESYKSQRKQGRCCIS